MGFNFGAFLAGGAEAIKEEADQERQDVKELFNTSAFFIKKPKISYLYDTIFIEKHLNFQITKHKISQQQQTH